ncbi:MAG: hypothetical protein KOO60_13280 [Gemmatimonadales bacterium]|nr:hypothetical protein [Gemmatimonadales bacterium]
MIRFALLVVVVLLLFAGFAQAFIEEVHFNPAIMEGDDLDVLVWGGLPDSCWEFLDWTTNDYNQKLVVNISTIMPYPPETLCLQVVTPYEVAAVFPSLSEGIYTLRIYENRPPEEPNILDFTVEVMGTVSADSETWDSIKSLFR